MSSSKIDNSPASNSETSFEIRSQTSADLEAVEILTMNVFGPGMFARAAYALREGVEPETHLSFVACKGEEIIGSVRLTKIRWGENTVLMLGPLGVLRKYKSLGAGRALMNQAVDTAREHVKQGGPKAIILVGDLAYYQQFGFERIRAGKIELPRPVDRMRVLVCDLVEGASVQFSGLATRFA